MYKVILLGASLDTGNLGVSALASSLIKLILQVRPDADISFFIGNRFSKPQSLNAPNGRIQINILNYRLSPKAEFKKHLLWIIVIACLQKIIPFKTLKEVLIKSNFTLNQLYKSDFIGDIRGGDSFSDIYGIRGIVAGSMPSIIALLLGKKLFLLPQTYGPYKSFISKKIADYNGFGGGRFFETFVWLSCNVELNNTTFYARPYEQNNFRFNLSTQPSDLCPLLLTGL